MVLKKRKTLWIIEFRFFWLKKVCKVSKENQKTPAAITFEFLNKEHV